MSHKKYKLLPIYLIIFLFVSGWCITGGVLAVAEEPAQGLLLFPWEAPQSVSCSEAYAVFEEALYKAGVYRPISVKELELLLKAQEVLLNNVFSEQDAVRTGRLLPAKLLAYVRLLTVKNSYLLQGKIIDAVTGETRLVESETATDLSGMAEAARRLAYRLCGLMAPAKNKEQGASLTVTSAEEMAAVFLDGRSCGTTPLVLEHLPFDNYFLEVKKGNLYYAEKINLKKDTMIYAKMVTRYGNLLIKTEPLPESVNIDGITYGRKAVIERLPAGEHQVLLSAPGLYWQGTVPVQADANIQITARLKPLAAIAIRADAGVNSVLMIGTQRLEAKGSIELKELVPGFYHYEATQPGFKTFAEDVLLKDGERLVLAPQLVWDEAHTEKELRTIDEIDTLKQAIMQLNLPVNYTSRPVPGMDMLAMRTMLLSFLPVTDFIFLFDKPDLPPGEAAFYSALGWGQLASGLLFQASLISVLVLKETDLKTYAGIGAGIFGVVTLTLGITDVIYFSLWTKKMKATKAGYDEKQKRLQELEKVTGNR